MGQFIHELTPLCKECWMPYCSHDLRDRETVPEAMERAFKTYNSIRYDGETFHKGVNIQAPLKVTHLSLLDRLRQRVET